MALVGSMMVACDTDIENETIVEPYTYSPQYYQNLRDYKAGDHAIAWGWFADYTQQYSPATRFLGLPDSLDICSLWGGIPSDDSTHVDTHYLPDVYRLFHTKAIKMRDIPLVILLCHIVYTCLAHIRFLLNSANPDTWSLQNI